MLASVRLEEKSSRACPVSVTTWRDRLYLAWTGTDYHVNLASSEDGSAITEKQRLAHRSYKNEARGAVTAFPPALAGSDVRLWLAWRNHSSLHICDAEHPDHPLPVMFEEQAWSWPSLTAAGPGVLTTAWTGTGPGAHLLTMTEDPSGEPLRSGDKSRLDMLEWAVPALCSHQGRLILAWTGTDKHINLASVA